MTKLPKWIWPVAAVSVAAVAVTAGFILARRAIPDTEAQLLAMRPILFVTITEPQDGAPLTAGQPTSIYVEAQADQPISALKLYLDGLPLEPMGASSPLDQPSASAVWLWTPSTPGTFRLTAQALTADGLGGFSNTVRFEVVERPPLPTAAPVTEPVEVASLEDLGLPFDLDNVEQYIDSVVASGAGYQTDVPSSPLASAVAQIPISQAIPADIPLGRTTPSLKYKLWMQGMVGAKNEVPSPAAPKVRGIAEGCEVQLVIQDFAEDETGLLLYHQGPQDPTFGLIAQFEAFPGQGAFFYTDPDRSLGTHLYYVSSVNAGGESLSNPSPIEVTDEACAQNNPLAISLGGAALTTDQPVDRLYCYVTLNDLDWSRIPADPKEFILPEGGTFDLSPYLEALVSPPKYPLKITLECWGWVGDTLVSLGTGTQTLYEGPAVIEGEYFAVQGNLQTEPVTTEGAGFILPNIAPPTNLHIPVDAVDCGDHTYGAGGAQTVCVDALNNHYYGKLVLVFDWTFKGDCQPGETCPYNKFPAGYNLYRQTPGHEPALIDVVPPQISMAAVYPDQAQNGDEFFVRAYWEGFESEDSNHYLYLPQVKKFSIPSGSYWSLVVRVHKGWPEKHVGTAYTPDFAEDPPCNMQECPTGGAFRVDMSKHLANLYKYVNVYQHVFFVFEVSQIEGMMTSARLRWNAEVHADGIYQNLWPDRCLTYITGPYGGTVVASPPLMLSGDLDVTSQLQMYREAPFDDVTPFGLWFKSGLTTLQDNETIDVYDYCSMNIHDVWLDVEMLEW